MNWRVPHLFSELDPVILEKLEKYNHELVKFNKKLNLVSPHTLDEADVLHFADSLFSSQIVYKKVNKNNILYDVGSGNGFPGLVFGIAFPDVQLALLDVDQRKCEFLKHVVARLQLKNVKVINSKIEDVTEGSIDQIITRGFAPIHKAEDYFSKPVSTSGRVYYLKSLDWEKERTNLNSGWIYSEVSRYNLPYVDRQMLVIEGHR